MYAKKPEIEDDLPIITNIKLTNHVLTNNITLRCCFFTYYQLYRLFNWMFEKSRINVYVSCFKVYITLDYPIDVVVFKKLQKKAKQTISCCYDEFEAEITIFGVRALISRAVPTEPAKSPTKMHLENRLYTILCYQHLLFITEGCGM